MSLVAKFGLDTSKIRRCICTPQVSVGHFVAIVGQQQSREVVDKADPFDYNKLPAVGMCISKLSAADCLIQFFGESPDLFDSLEPGEIYFLGENSFISITPPKAVTQDVFVQNVGVALSPSRFFIKPETNLVLRRL